MIIPNICKNKTCSKPPTSYHCDILILPCCWRNPWRAFSVNRFHRFHPTLVTIQPWTSMVSKLTNYQFSQTSESPETQKNSSESTQFPMATRTEDDWGDRSLFWECHQCHHFIGNFSGSNPYHESHRFGLMTYWTPWRCHIFLIQIRISFGSLLYFHGIFFGSARFPEDMGYL